MIKALICLLISGWCITVHAQTPSEKEIVSRLNQSAVEWNKGDIDAFMKDYWNDDSVMYVGKSGVTYGYDKILNNYKKGYPDTAAMGKLSFDIIQVKPLSPEHYFVVGKWMLKRSIGDVSGHYTLILRRIKGEWKIVADHSS